MIMNVLNFRTLTITAVLLDCGFFQYIIDLLKTLMLIGQQTLIEKSTTYWRNSQPRKTAVTTLKIKCDHYKQHQLYIMYM